MSARTLDGRVAVVTGGGSGLGREIALEYAEHGCSVVVASVVAEQNDAVVAECEALGAKAIAATVNVADEQEVETMAAAARKEFGRIDVLVAAAGVGGPSPGGTVDTDLDLPLRAYTLEQWNRVLEINLTGVFLSARAVIPAMIERGEGGSIFSFTSAVVRDAAMPSPGSYAVSKWAIEGLMKRLAKELDEFAIRVNILQPGGQTHTPLLGKMYKGERPSTRHEARVVRPSALFLASEASRFTTGRMLVADQFNRDRGIVACDCDRCCTRLNPPDLGTYPLILT
jgi:NAD(P)-dependent dehydrogenase (short-subunit alcohol dehydrogenase family)